MTLALLLLACSGGDDSNTTDDTGGADDSATTDTEPPCATVSSGNDWAWNGACPQMRTPVAITVTDCEMVLDYESVGGMTMGMPYSATIDGDTVTFGDDDTITGCVGTVDTADAITGTCGDGCTFQLSR